MENKDERYLNITLNNKEDDKGDVIISFSGIFKKLKKYFLIWLVTAVVAAVAILSGFAIFSADQHKSMSALVSFTFDGIEEGKDPNGNVFDPKVLKKPAIIEAALTELGYPLDQLETIRQGITITEIIPADALDRMTVYKSIYESAANGALTAAQEILDTSYYPTQYTVKFNYAKTGFTNEEAALVFNTVLEGYRDYFFETYGYNEALGSAVTALDYNDYDYAEAVDVFGTTLTALKKYVNNLATDDTARFRSAATGYTFSDLSEAIKAVQNMDLDLLSSYITVNNVTKDKDTLIYYYEYRIQALTREKTVASENLATITESINNYEKDTVMIFGNGTENTDTQYTMSSDKYNSLIQQRINTQNDLSTITQQISYYNERLKALKATPAGGDAKKDKVEADLEKLNEKVNGLIESVNKTADEYYNTVAYANCYNILVPASASTVKHTIKNVISDSMMVIFVIEALLVIVYIMFAFVTALIAENKKKNVSAAADTVSGAEAEAKEEKKEKSEKKSK